MWAVIFMRTSGQGRLERQGFNGGVKEILTELLSRALPPAAKVSYILQEGSRLLDDLMAQKKISNWASISLLIGQFELVWKC